MAKKRKLINLFVQEDIFERKGTKKYKKRIKRNPLFRSDPLDLADL